MAMLSAQDAAAKAGISVHTLRYYERVALIPPVARAKNGHRRYGPTDLEWILFVSHLRETGMPIAAIRRYTSLVLAGNDGAATIAERLQILQAHREFLTRQIALFTASLELLDGKIEGYRAHYARLQNTSDPTTPFP